MTSSAPVRGEGPWGRGGRDPGAVRGLPAAAGRGSAAGRPERGEGNATRAPREDARPGTEPRSFAGRFFDRFTPGVRSALMVLAALLTGLAILLPLWGMTLASIQYPEGLRMVVYPTRIAGDLREINMLNGYIGMPKVSREFFLELQVLPYLLGAAALLTLAVAFVRHAALRALPLLGLAGIAAYGFRSMALRMHQYGHELDPMAPIDIEPFTPPMFGENQIAQFGTYAYFSWGTVLPLFAGLLIALVVWADIQEARARRRGEAP